MVFSMFIWCMYVCEINRRMDDSVGENKRVTDAYGVLDMLTPHHKNIHIRIHIHTHIRTAVSHRRITPSLSGIAGPRRICVCVYCYV